MESALRTRRVVAVIIIVAIAGWFVVAHESFWSSGSARSNSGNGAEIEQVLNQLAVKGRAPMTGYTRQQFGGVWEQITNGCDARDVILHRDMKDVQVNSKCQVTRGILDDPYTGKVINFVRGPSTSSLVQIDHVVAIGNAWVTGAQALSLDQRKALYNDPLELLAVDGAANNQKSDGDAATWLPPNKSFRCQYVARQIAVKAKYHLWVTQAEKQMMQTILSNCPGQTLPVGALAK